MKLAVALGWHLHPWEELLALVLRAESLGYAAAFVDGDDTMLESRVEADLLDGWTVTSALLASTSRIGIGSMRLIYQWNAARLAQAVASALRIAPGRLRFLVSVGDRENDTRFGFPRLTVGERIRWLDEALAAMRALWSGETVTCQGRYVRLEGARVRPVPPGGSVPVAVAAQGPRMLEVVAAHADVWDVNLPAIPSRVQRAERDLEAACGRIGRDPGQIARSMLIFARPGVASEAALSEFRRLNPWFRSIPDGEIRPSLPQGDAAACRRQLEDLVAELRIDCPVIDLAGLSGAACERIMEALAPTE